MPQHEKNFATGVGTPIAEALPPAVDPNDLGEQALPFNFATGIGALIDQVIPDAPEPIKGRKLVDIPGTLRFKEREIATGQVSTGEKIAQGFESMTGLAPLMRVIEDEGVLFALTPNLFGWQDQFQEGEKLDQEKAQAELDPRIDRDLAMDLLLEPTDLSFNRRHARVIEELDVIDSMNIQHAGAGVSHMIGAMLDLDMLAGGLASKALGAAKLAAKTTAAARRVGLTIGASRRVTSGALGLNVGLQGGALVGISEFSSKETSTWQELAAVLVASTALTGILGSLTNASGKFHDDVILKSEKEFLDRVRRDDPNLSQPVNAGRMDPGNAIPDTATVIGGEAPRGVGAEATGAGGRPKRVLDDPQGPIGREEEDIINFTDERLWESDFHEKKAKAAGSLWTKLALSKIGGFSVQDFNKLYTSKSAVLNYMSSFVFESASGLGRGNTTSSVMQDIYHRQVMESIGNRDISPLRNAWAVRNNHTWQGTGKGISAKGQKAFDRELMLERNERAMGRNSNPSKEIKEAADRFDNAAERGLVIAVGEEGEMAIDGMVAGMKRPGYNPYRHDGAQIELLIAQGVRRSDIEAAYAQAYRQAGMSMAKDAEAVAKAVVTRALKREQNLDGSMVTLLSGDGREFMKESLTNSGLSQVEVDAILTRLIGSVEDRAKEGFAKSRNELDMSVKIKNDLGLDLRLVDMMEQDMDRTWQRYARQVSGAAALARVGITNKAKRTTFIKAAQAEQRALGEEVMDANLLEAMFSHFNAGPTHGFFDGVTNEGIGIVLATAKRIANLGLLEKLGITQLGETGATIAQIGVVNWYRRGPMVAFDKELRAAGGALLDEVAYITGPLGRDEQFYAEWFDLDDVGAVNKANWLQTASKISSNAAYVQNYINAFNHVRKYQQKITVLGMIDKVMRTVKAGDMEGMLARFETDLGMGLDELDLIEGMVESGLIEFSSKGYVTKLNLHKWDPKLRRNFGAALVRNMHQTVQKSLAGEQDAWMHTGWGSLMTHLMTFPMQAFQKQFIRNGRMMDLTAGAAMAFGLTSAMVAVNIRDVIDGRDRTQQERAVQAFTYNNMTGWIPMIVDPAMTIMGFDDQRINSYGAYNSVIPPVFGQADDLRRAPGALRHAMLGENDYHDQQALKAIPFAGVYFANRLWGLGASRKQAQRDADAAFAAGMKPQNVTDPNETGPPAPTAPLSAAENFANRESLKDFLEK